MSIQKLDNTLYIKKISYGSSGSGVGINEVKFSYQRKESPSYSYVGGELFGRKDRLNKIEIFANGNSFRKYNLAFFNRDSLRYIEEVSGNGSERNSRIVLTYDSGSGSPQYALTTSNLGVVDIQSNNSEVVPLDLNRQWPNGFYGLP